MLLLEQGGACCYDDCLLLWRLISKMEESATYTIRPNFKDKFRPSLVNDMIYKVLKDNLHDKQYSVEAETWCKAITDVIKNNLKELDLKRYKYIVQVVIGEQRGEGVKIGSRCLWDTDTDNYSQGLFINDSLFAVGVAYAIYYY